MRILFISTFYPPYIIGGWEQLVQEINHQLQQRSHITRVLTSLHGLDKPVRDNGVDRLLSLESDLFHYKPLSILSYNQRLNKNLTYLKNVVESFNPDVIFIHIMWNLNRKIAWLAEQLCPGRVVYYIADHWPYSPDPTTQYWQDSARKPIIKVAKKLIAPVLLRMLEREKLINPLEFRHVLCVSQAIKESLIHKGGLDSENITVVYNGIDTSLFLYKEPVNGDRPSGLSLLYAGSLVWHKGIHTAIKAMATLAKNPNMDGVTLTIIGSGHPDYVSQLNEMVESEGLKQRVQFSSRVKREDMPVLLQQFDALILPSIWDEPLARIVQEAMASGLVVIGTDTGGTKEILEDGETGLIFSPEDAHSLAECIQRLIDNPDLIPKLVKNGREVVARRFDIHRMVDEIEIYLEKVARSRRQIETL